MSDEPRNRRGRPECKFQPEEVQIFRSKRPPYTEHRHVSVGGRLRVAHEHFDTLSIVTSVERFVPGEVAVVRAEVTAPYGTFTGYGTASGRRDPDRAQTLLENAETRAIGRALRWTGIGVEMVSAEEMEGMAEAAAEQMQRQQTCTPGQSAEIYRLFAQLDLSPEQQQAGLKLEGVAAVKELSEDQANRVLVKLKDKLTAMRASTVPAAEGAKQ